jgi:hypothetical protein
LKVRDEQYIARAIFEAVGEGEENDSHAAKCNKATSHNTVDMVATPLVGEDRAEYLKYKHGASRQMLGQIA